MGRCLKSTAKPAGVGEARRRLQVRAPAICHVDDFHSNDEWQSRLARVADLGLDHVCLSPFLTRRNAPLLISDLAKPNPGLGIGGSTEQAVHEIATLCERRGLRLCLDDDLIDLPLASRLRLHDSLVTDSTGSLPRS